MGSNTSDAGFVEVCGELMLREALLELAFLEMMADA